REPLVLKRYPDSFEETTLESLLADLAVGRLVVVGAQTDECVRSTLHGALVRGYDATLVSDAHTTEDLSPWGAPPPDLVIAHTNLYWGNHEAPGRVAGTVEVDVLRFDGARHPSWCLMVPPIQIRVRDDEIRRRRAPWGEILGRMRIADERRVIAANERAVQRRADTFVGLRADDDQATNGEGGKDALERRLLERVRVTLLNERLTPVRAQLRDDLPLLASLREIVARVLHPNDRNLRRASFLDDCSDVCDIAVPLI